MIVLEQFSELDVLLQAASRLGVSPVIGIRARLTTRHAGHWGSTSGDGAKFGLRPAEIVAVVNKLSSKGMLDCLKLLHFHAGSQADLLQILKAKCAKQSFYSSDLFFELGSAPNIPIWTLQWIA